MMIYPKQSGSKALAVGLLGVFIAFASADCGVAQPVTGKPVSALPAKPSRQAVLTALFQRLSAAQDAVEAKGIGDQIERLWDKSGSDTADLLMSRVSIAIKARNYDLALDLLDSILTLEPQWPEAWNKRATVLYMTGDYAGSMHDIQETLAREPRHFGAIAGISIIYSAMGDTKRAYKAAKAALAIYPFMSGMRQYVDGHSREVDGQAL